MTNMICKEVSVAREVQELAPASVGDAIGETVYSERFVLKIMIKLTNLDSYKLDLNSINFEEDLCILWDMSAEKDVCAFMMEHFYFNLISFVFPHTNNSRILEITIGIIANMCCVEEIVSKLISEYKNLCINIFETVHTDDSSILIQVLRFVHCCFYNSTDNQVNTLLNILKNSEFDSSVFFIMRNSCNKNVLMAALEAVNCISTKCNTGECSREFFNLFVSDKLLSSLTVTFTELSNLLDNESNEMNIGRFHNVYLEISSNLANFQGISLGTLNEFSDTVIYIVNYYKLIILKTNDLTINLELVDIFEYMNTIICTLNLQNHTSMQGILICVLNLCLHVVSKFKNINSNTVFVEDGLQHIEKFNNALSSIIKHFVFNMSDDALRIVLNSFKNYELSSIVVLFNKSDSDMDIVLQRLSKFNV